MSLHRRLRKHRRVSPKLAAGSWGPEPLEHRLLLTGVEPGDLRCDGTAPLALEPTPAEERHLDGLGNELHVLPPVATPTQLALTADGTIQPEASIPLSETWQLNSRPGAAHTIFLDFNGHVTSGTIWNSAFTGGTDISTPAFNLDGVQGFSDAELTRIQNIWQRVAEDFIPFDVNVTTADPGPAALTRSGSGDSAWGVRVAIGGSSYDWYGAGAGGVAYVGSFTWNSDSPAFVFEDQLGNGSEKYVAEAISHEVGHSLGLSHDGRTSPVEEYYQGQGSGATGWAPILGVGYYRELTQWSRGEYANASQLQDDLAIITSNNGFGYRADDHGDTAGTATLLPITAGTLAGSGVIETRQDQDVFVLDVGAGDIALDVSPAARGPNLDILAELYGADGQLVAWSNPVDQLGATISASVSGGTYYLHVSGTGKGDPLTDGYSDYGSLGQYTIGGTATASSGSQLTVTAVTTSALEGDSGTTEFVFQVTRSGSLDLSSDVGFAVTGAGSSPASVTDFEGGSLPQGALTFLPGESLKLISVLVAGDTTSEADETFTLTIASTSSQTTVARASASAVILNDDAVAGIGVSPTSGLSTSERGGTATFNVWLLAQPTTNVVIQLRSSDAGEGVVAQQQLTFTPQNWDTPQQVTVRGVDDTVRDGNVSYTVFLDPATSSDTRYEGLDPDDVQLTNQDNEKGKIGGGTSGGGGTGGGGNGGGKGGGKKAAAAMVSSFESVPQESESRLSPTWYPSSERSGLELQNSPTAAGLADLAPASSHAELKAADEDSPNASPRQPVPADSDASSRRLPPAASRAQAIEELAGELQDGLLGDTLWLTEVTAAWQAG